MVWLKAVIDYGVIGLLLAMSIVAVAIAIERHRYYRRLSPAGLNVAIPAVTL